MPRSSNDEEGAAGSVSFGHFALEIVLARSFVPSPMRAMRCARREVAIASVS